MGICLRIKRINMTQNHSQVAVNRLIILILVLISTLALKKGYTGSGTWYRVLAVTLPLLMLAIVKIRHRKHSGEDIRAKTKSQKRPTALSTTTNSVHHAKSK
jgi:hypothetical protein